MQRLSDENDFASHALCSAWRSREPRTLGVTNTKLFGYEEANMADDIQKNLIDIDDLIEVWKVLENLTVSLDRLGSFESFHGEAAAKDALYHYIGPELFDQISTARHILVTSFERLDPAMIDRLAAISDNEINYWDGPK